jgi:hypothetical protein
MDRFDLESTVIDLEFSSGSFSILGPLQEGFQIIGVL